ncbi:MAG: EF-P lysine aminoacylase EpmA [Desulfobacterales bacterium]
MSAPYPKAPNRQHGIRRNLELRATVIRTIRQFFAENDYLEVETPIRIPAPAPEAHIDAQSSGSWFLQTSPELSMKRLLAAGYPRIFQICKCFRRKERGRQHIPELTLLEWYTTGHDYSDMMTQCEALLTEVADSLGLRDGLCYQGQRIDLSLPWPRITVAEAFERLAGKSVEQAMEEDRFEEVLALKIEPRLGIEKPLFLYDYPAACGALARLKPSNPRLAERFELYIGGLELCNAFTELNDGNEQRARFDAERELRRQAGLTVYPMPESFLEALKDMPDAAGNALGIDRLVMLFANTTEIDDVVAFTPEEL